MDNIKSNFDLLEFIALKKFASSEALSAFKIAYDDCDNVIVSLSKYRVLKTGKNKGNKKWDKKPIYTIVVTDMEVKECIEEYISVTGNCSRCFGDGKVIKRVVLKPEYIKEYSECRRCSGTGKAEECNTGSDSKIDP